MNDLRQKTQAITDALLARLSPEEIEAIHSDLETHWCDSSELIRSDAPKGADVLLFALADAALA